MRTKVMGKHIDAYPIYNVARQKGYINCDWEQFHKEYLKYKPLFNKISLCFLGDNEYIFIEDSDIKFLNRSKSKGYVVEKGKYRVRIQYDKHMISKYFDDEYDAMEFYKDKRKEITYSIYERLCEIYNETICDKFKNKYL